MSYSADKEVEICYWTALEFIEQVIVTASVDSATKKFRIFAAIGNCPSLFG